MGGPVWKLRLNTHIHTHTPDHALLSVRVDFFSGIKERRLVKAVCGGEIVGVSETLINEGRAVNMDGLYTDD